MATPVSVENEKVDFVDAISEVQPATSNGVVDQLSEKPPVLANGHQNGKSSGGDSLDEKASTASTYKYAVTREEFMSPNFQPDEMRKIAREAILLAGGAVAILLQVAEPGVGRGVDEHSNFAYRPLDRLRTTMTYVYCMIYGTPQEKQTIIDMVHKAHSVVRGEGYSANDPELQLWVAATLYAAGTEIYEKFFGGFDEATSDEIYREYSVLASSLRVPPELWPVDRAAFWAYFDKKVDMPEITPYAKHVCSDLLFNKKTPLWIRANMPAIRILTAEWLPPRMREEYGLKRKPRRYKAMMALAKIVYPVLPLSIRSYPVKYYLKDMRKRMRNAV
jgi:uncharacterized protein (DUF2236 family)